MSADSPFIHWITRNAAGLRQPGLHGDLNADLRAIRDAGIRLLVTLSVDPLPSDRLARYKIAGRHFPILGMGVPSVDAAVELVEELAEELRRGTKLGFHCTAGIGRTGMMLACHLVWRGVSPPDAIVRVRQHIPRAIQTSGQEAFVHQFFEAVRPERRRPK